jgi:hypothetical protein
MFIHEAGKIDHGKNIQIMKEMGYPLVKNWFKLDSSNRKKITQIDD